MNNNNNLYEYIECACHSTEHIIGFGKLNSNGDWQPELYMSIHLAQHDNIFKRIWTAIKYIFGYKCIYGCFDEFMFTTESATQMIDILTKYKKECEKYYEEKI